jgi:CheY-like chemotaxis protein
MRLWGGGDLGARRLGIRRTPPHILLVDDDPQVVQYLRIVLEENGYTVAATTSGDQALAIMREHIPDLLILDLNMPAPDGFDLLKVKTSQFPHLKILVISGYLHGSLLQAATLVGASAVLEKPVTAEELIAKVREVLGR